MLHQGFKQRKWTIAAGFSIVKLNVQRNQSLSSSSQTFSTLPPEDEAAAFSSLIFFRFLLFISPFRQRWQYGQFSLLRQPSALYRK
mmetsp:Transcript_48076/g.107971  ORF Transcript_48076/g.107971 Transcript_48076/m.107971 type:complete len:86 (+) Transcript_48076:176-433(+)